METARNIKQFIRSVEDQEWLESLSNTVEEDFVIGAYEKLGEAQWPIRNVLHGSVLGHPLHPMVSDIPVGAFTMTFIFDALDVLLDRKDLRPGADTAILIGLLGGSITALSGFADWKHTKEGTQRTGLLHGMLNLGASGLYLSSLLMRRARARGAGQVFSTLGFGLTLAGAYLGGELVFDRLVGTSRVQEPEEPEEFTVVAALEDLDENTPYQIEVNETPIVLVRSNGQINALSDICAHLGRALSGGEVNDGCITCPAHGSTYNLETGAVVTGPAAFPQPRFDVRVRDGNVEVRRPY